MTLRTCYKYAVIIPSVLVVTGYILYAILYVTLGWGHRYKNEWGDSNAFLLLVIFIAMIKAVITCCLSATLFLNAYVPVRNNALLSFLSWFLLPMIWLGGLPVYELYQNRGSSNGQGILFLANTLPFVLGLLVTFILYRRNIPSSSS
jgi:hypothetical protein